MDPTRHVEQFEVIEREIIESRRPIPADEAINYLPTSEIRRSTEIFTNRAKTPTPYDIGFKDDDLEHRYHLTGERDRERDASFLFSGDSPLTKSVLPIHSSTPEKSYPTNNPQTTTNSGINNYGYDLSYVQTSEGGARIVQTHGSGQPIIDGGYDLNSTPIKTTTTVPLFLTESPPEMMYQHDRSQMSTTMNLSAPFRTPPTDNGVFCQETITREVDIRTSNAGPQTEERQIPQATLRRPRTAAGAGAAAAAAATVSYGELPQNTSQVSENLHSILKNADSWRQFSSSEDNSLTRKDSYKRMQKENEAEKDNASLFYAPSNATIVTKNSGQKWTPSSGSKIMNGGRSKRDTDNLGCWGATKFFFKQTFQQIRDCEWSTNLILRLLLLGLLLFLVLFLLWQFISAIFLSYYGRSFLLYPPICEECLKRNPSGVSYKPPSTLYIHLSSPAQAHFELIGNPPFRSSSFTAVDFDTGYIAIADHALTNDDRKHTICFIMQLDRNALPDMSVLRDAIDNTYHEVRTQFGWQEYWQYNPEPVDSNFIFDKFKDEIDQCKNAKWYFLRHSVYTKDSACSQCYDFCLPDYAAQRRQKYEDDVSLGIRRLNCFRLYVPEWSRFSVRTDENGGHWQYPTQNNDETQKSNYKISDSLGNWIDTRMMKD